MYSFLSIYATSMMMKYQMSVINKCFVLNIHSVDMTMRAHIYTEKREIAYLSCKPILRYLLTL